MKALINSFAFAPMVLASSLAVVPAAQATGSPGNTCVYVLGNVEGRSITTPAILVVVPETSVTLGPLRVHVDPTSQSVLGYHIALPGLDYTTPSQGIYVPGVNRQIPSFTVTLQDVSVQNKTCVSFGVTTPAVPIHIPPSVFMVPGAVVETPELTINALGVSKTVSGQVINVEGRTIVVPGVNETVPSLTVGTPDRTIAVNINGALHSAGIMNLP